MTDVIVIGGGVIGASVAYRLAQSGARVTLLEAKTLAAGTSSTSFAWMNSNNKAPIEYHRLNVAGMSEHSILREEFGGAPWLHVHGNVIWGDESRATAGSEPDVPIVGESLESKVQRLRDWNYPVEVLSPSELSYIHPDIKPPDDVERVTLYPAEGYVDVPLLIATLIRASSNLGAVIQTDQEVVGIVKEAGRVVGVRTAAGDQFAADVVVSCVGRWTDHVTELTGVRIPMAPTLGLLVVSTPVAIGLRALAHTPKVNVRPDGGSRIIMASFELDKLLNSDSSPEILRDLAGQVLERAGVILPALAGSAVESYKLGIRAIPYDGLPVVGPIDGLDGFYTISTHSGVTMGPFLGRVAAQEILCGRIDDRLATFRPDRLISARTVRA